MANLKASESKSEKVEKIIEVKNVTKTFDGVTVVDDVNLSIKKGEFITLLGPSGCGKTTLLRMIAGFTSPDRGRIFIGKKDVTELPPHKRSVNTVFQKYALFPHLNVFKNVAFGIKLKKIYVGEQEDKKGNKKTVYRKFTKKEISDKVHAALKMVGLEEYGHRDVNSLSGGQQQRVAIARALVCEPQVLLLDEPLGALDLKMRKDMQNELISMHKNLGITFVYVTHDQEEALTMSDNIVVINDGVIQQYGTPKKIYDEPANAFVADFIGESNILSGRMPEDFKVEFCGKTFACLDKGFDKGEGVDLVIRPEDIKVYPAETGKGQLDAVVLSSVFKGTYYEMEIKGGDYEFTVQNTKNFAPGSLVELKIEPDAIHIMKKLRTVNSYITEIDGENTVNICGGSFEFVGEGYEKGDNVRVTVPFDAVELCDDEVDGVIGGNIAQSLYKGTYYQVQVYTDDDNDFYVNTTDEWDHGDRVGINIKPACITLEKMSAEQVEEAERAESEGGEVYGG